MRALLALPLIAAAAPAAAPVIAPGLWEVTSAATIVEMPGIPAPLLNRAGKPKVTRRCVTPEQATRGPIETMRNRPGCTLRRTLVAAGTPDLPALCPDRGNGRTTLAVSGSYTAVSYSMAGSMRGTGGPNGDMRVDFTESARRVGDCP